MTNPVVGCSDAFFSCGACGSLSLPFSVPTLESPLQLNTEGFLKGLGICIETFKTMLTWNVTLKYR